MRQLEDEPRLRDALHPRADLRDQLSDPEKPEIAVAEGAQSNRPRRRREPADPFRRFRSPGHCLTVHAAWQLPEAAWNEFAQWFRNGSRAEMLVRFGAICRGSASGRSSNAREGLIVNLDSAWH